MDKVKLLGQVFTPSDIVNLTLDNIGYNNRKNMLKKYIMDNSCGDGSFLGIN